MKKIPLSILIALTLASFAFAEAPATGTPATPVQEKPECCLKAEKDGKTCQKACCVKAAKEGKVCEKCLKHKHHKKDKTDTKAKEQSEAQK